MEKKYSYEELLEIVDRLRAEDGCPWDREQTHQSLVPYLLEESYELVEALQNDDKTLMEEELGDVLFQVIMHARIAKEEQAFDMGQVVNGLATKLVQRHPHVFKEGEALKTVEQVNESWEEIKKNEKQEKTLVQSLDRVAKTLPALMRTQKVQKKVLKSQEENFNSIKQINQLIRELEGLKRLYSQENKGEAEDEIGKILFGVVKLSTFFDINAEFALTKSVEKFINRFRYIENSRFTKD